MSSGIEIVPTIVPRTFSDVRDVSNEYAGFTSFFQIDVADGKFAPNITWLPKAGDMLPKEYGYEVHMMVENPGTLGTLFARSGARTLIAHVETFGEVETTTRMFKEWRSAGVSSIGGAMLLQSPIEQIEPYLPHLDFVLFMTIARIGVQGIPYEPAAPARIAEFHARYKDVQIAVDGGVSEKNIEELSHAGATHFGVGSAIAKAADPKATYERLMRLAQNAVK